MFVIIFFYLISKINSVSGDRDVETQDVNDFDWNEIG